MKIIVISITSYKEKDAIIDAIGEEGPFAFLAKGVFDPKNKNAALKDNLVRADIELSEGNHKYPVLKECSIIDTPLKITSDYYYMSAVMFMAETTKCLLQEEDKARIYQPLNDALEAMNKKKNIFQVVLTYIAQVLKVSGYDFEVNRCVFCGSQKDIRLFSFNDGGFVCGNCLSQDMKNELTKEQMLLLRQSFNALDYESDFQYCSKENAQTLLNKFYEFICETFGVSLKSIALLNK